MQLIKQQQQQAGRRMLLHTHTHAQTAGQPKKHNASCIKSTGWMDITTQSVTAITAWVHSITCNKCGIEDRTQNICQHCYTTQPVWTASAGESTELDIGRMSRKAEHQHYDSWTTAKCTNSGAENKIICLSKFEFKLLDSIIKKTTSNLNTIRQHSVVLSYSQLHSNTCNHTWLRNPAFNWHNH